MKSSDSILSSPFGGSTGEAGVGGSSGARRSHVPGAASSPELSGEGGSRDAFARRLEIEGLLDLPRRAFALSPQEAALMGRSLSLGRVKNISLSPDGAVRGTAADVEATALLAGLLERYARWAAGLIGELAPRYLAALERGRTSFRPRAVEDAPASPRKDDRRLHVDAFASQPTGGRRILRVFSNINPQGEARVWRVGEPFEDHARRWVGQARRPLPGETWALQRLGITKARRTPYDAMMLALHDAAKLDETYQRAAPRREIAFPAGASWTVFTDSVVHAAISGRHALEQTFYLPISAMAAPEASPLRVLERIAGRRLT